MSTATFQKPLSRPTLRQSARQSAESHSHRFLRYWLYAQMLAIDTASIVFGISTGYAIRFGYVIDHSFANIILTLIPIYLIFALTYSAYSVDSLRTPDRAGGRAVGAIMMATLILFVLGFFLRVEQEISRLAMTLGLFVSAGSLFVTRYLFVHFIVSKQEARLSKQAIIIDHKENGSSPFYEGAFEYINAREEGLSANRRDPLMLDRLAVRLAPYDRIVVACDADDRREWSLILKGANVRAEIVVPEFDSLGALTLSHLHGDRTLVVSAGPMALRDRILKRGFDLALALPALLVLLPVLMLIAVAIRLDSPGPIFFRQQRVGQGNRLFNVFKFRSMRVELTDSDGSRSAARDDDRITRVGGFLRRTSLDELPQLLNVLNGSMSIVGPRPHALGSQAEEQHFWDVDEQYWHRHLLRPGITGLAQVRGFRGATVKRMDLIRRVQADLEYISGWSLWRDIAIVLRTIKVLTHPNAY